MARHHLPPTSGKCPKGPLFTTQHRWCGGRGAGPTDPPPPRPLRPTHPLSHPLSLYQEPFGFPQPHPRHQPRPLCLVCRLLLRPDIRGADHKGGGGGGGRSQCTDVSVMSCAAKGGRYQRRSIRDRIAWRVSLPNGLRTWPGTPHVFVCGRDWVAPSPGPGTGPRPSTLSFTSLQCGIRGQARSRAVHRPDHRF